ncbi:Xylose isomerase protein [Dioscorea alata]|uniref:Xylose isomerase protein n=1 Tax=Dioscorea alata TaxID=55571 RepID=A0ACB7U676_DIOAL|nr:Xylose isomerase protein [Dioscorea alata]
MEKASDSLGNVIPQLDGSPDDHLLTTNKCKRPERPDLLNIEKEKDPDNQELKCASATIDCKSKRSKHLWNNLPLSQKLNECETSQTASANSSPGDEMMKDCQLGSSFESRVALGFKDSKVDREASDDKVGKTMATCSVRDLMRTKGFSRPEHLEPEINLAIALPDMQKNEMMAGCTVGSVFASVEGHHYTMVDETRYAARYGDEGLQEIAIDPLSPLGIDHTENRLLHDAKKQSENHNDEIGQGVSEGPHLCNPTDSNIALDTNAPQTKKQLDASINYNIFRNVQDVEFYEVDTERSHELNGEFFPEIPTIKYEGPNSKNPLAYKWYNADEEILGKKMKDWLRFSVAFWHTFRGTRADPFGAPTKAWPWENGTNSVAMVKTRMRAHFEFITKLGVERWCFHDRDIDRDIAPNCKTLAESNENLDEIIELAAELQKGTKILPLWGTAQLFMHPKYMHGAATSSELGAYSYAAAQVKKAMEVTHYLGGENFARFLQAAVDWKKKIGFNGTLLIEPKPQEPTKHQYDWDAATTLSFLQKYGLSGEFKLNIECNHATLSGHSCHHELETARINGLLGNIDANTGDPQIGWDTDQFLTDIGEATLIMLSVIRNRRESTDVTDMFIAHISGMDTLARGLRNAAKLIEKGKADFVTLEKKAMEWGEPSVASGKQELAEMIFQSAL